MKVNLTREAMIDLDKILDWIGKDNPQRALSFVDQLYEKCEQLAEMPEAWPLKKNPNPRKARVRVWRKYLIVYVILENQIDVLHVVNGARDLDGLLEGQT
jgi:toxin ParE1/3/4